MRDMSRRPEPLPGVPIKANRKIIFSSKGRFPPIPLIPELCGIHYPEALEVISGFTVVRWGDFLFV